MRIGSGKSFLSIEKVGSAGRGPVWRLESEIIGDSWAFSTIDCAVNVDTSGGVSEELEDFAASRLKDVDVLLPDGGWLRMKRASQGEIVVRYHLSRLNAGAALQGEVVVEPGSADGFCKEFGALL
jgi:hypothetical protein